MRKADNLPPSCAVVTKSGSLNFLEPSGPVQACNGTALPFYSDICSSFPDVFYNRVVTENKDGIIAESKMCGRVLVLLEACCVLCVDISSSLTLRFIHSRSICYTSFIFRNTFSNVMTGTFCAKV